VAVARLSAARRENVQAAEVVAAAREWKNISMRLTSRPAASRLPLALVRLAARAAAKRLAPARPMARTRLSARSFSLAAAAAE
jgi:hypothetical protein